MLIVATYYLYAIVEQCVYYIHTVIHSMQWLKFPTAVVKITPYHIKIDEGWNHSISVRVKITFVYALHKYKACTKIYNCYGREGKANCNLVFCGVKIFPLDSFKVVFQSNCVYSTYLKPRNYLLIWLVMKIWVEIGV